MGPERMKIRNGSAAAVVKPVSDVIARERHRRKDFMAVTDYSEGSDRGQTASPVSC